MKAKVAINGFGRIGREIFRINLEKDYFEVVAINDLTDNATLAHLLKYDSNFGKLDAEIELKGEDEMLINGTAIKVLSEKDPTALPWKELGVDIVIEATGAFSTREGMALHQKAGAKRVILSAPCKDEPDATLVLGVNEDSYDPEKDTLISNASCTTNSLAPVAKLLHDALEIEKGLITTIHSYTATQNILDGPHKDLRRARSAGQSIIPTTTGAAKAVTLVIPELEGKLDGLAVRVPTPTVSLTDFTCIVKKDTTVKEVNEIFSKAAATTHKDILGYSEEPLVSVDYKGDPRSSIIDALSTKVLGGNMVKLFAWYDNEWGYSARIVDLVKFVADKD